MDDRWDRSNPLVILSRSDISGLFFEYDRKITVLSCSVIAAGCRNSNYRVHTDRGEYLLRICLKADHGFVNEQVVYSVLHDKIRIPRLYYAARFNDYDYLIYEYLSGRTLNSILSDRSRVTDSIVRQAAQTAALIHNHRSTDFPGLEQTELPPFKRWFELFLSNPRTIERIGLDTADRINRLVEGCTAELQEIDRYHSFIHSDFRPANMLLEQPNLLYFIDWEFAGNGHPLADIGQFFRYRSFFDTEHLKVFEAEYNQYASVALPQIWYRLSLLRDLVNPLQMLGGKENLPLKYQDLQSLIHNTLEFWGY
jgi:thiamine kinase-like enzyme